MEGDKAKVSMLTGHQSTSIVVVADSIVGCQSNSSNPSFFLYKPGIIHIPKGVTQVRVDPSVKVV